MEGSRGTLVSDTVQEPSHPRLDTIPQRPRTGGNGLFYPLFHSVIHSINVYESLLCVSILGTGLTAPNKADLSPMPADTVNKSVGPAGGLHSSGACRPPRVEWHQHIWGLGECLAQEAWPTWLTTSVLLHPKLVPSPVFFLL